MKCSFLMLALIIHGKEFETSGNVDVYLEPFIEELHILWKRRFDLWCTPRGDIFLKGNVHVEHTWLFGIWVIYRCVTKGLVGCPPCGPSTESWSSKKLKKVVYYGNRCYLPRNHPYQWTQGAFNGETRSRVAPICIIVTDTIKWGKEREAWLQGSRNRVGAKHALFHKHDIKWHSTMFKLMYWEVSIAQCKPNVEFYNMFKLLYRKNLHTPVTYVVFIVAMNYSPGTP